MLININGQVETPKTAKWIVTYTHWTFIR